MKPGIATLLADEWRFLTFRSPGGAIREHRGRYLAMGFLFAWIAGIGRYWDNPRADPLQAAGLGSVAYVFALAGLLWVLLAPLRPRNGSPANVLLFVAMTSPPAILYAIPVERFLDEGAAATANVWFLAVVALWRVALWFAFLRRTARLGWETAVIATLLPIALVITALAMLNLEHAVFQIMGGFQQEGRSYRDAAYRFVVTLSFLAAFSCLILVPAYLLAIAAAWSRGRKGIARERSGSG